MIADMRLTRRDVAAAVRRALRRIGFGARTRPTARLGLKVDVTNVAEVLELLDGPNAR
jgi:hypothetical protein